MFYILFKTWYETSSTCLTEVRDCKLCLLTCDLLIICCLNVHADHLGNAFLNVHADHFGNASLLCSIIMQVGKEQRVAATAGASQQAQTLISG